MSTVIYDPMSLKDLSGKSVLVQFKKVWDYVEENVPRTVMNFLYNLSMTEPLDWDESERWRVLNTWNGTDALEVYQWIALMQFDGYQVPHFAHHISHITVRCNILYRHSSFDSGKREVMGRYCSTCFVLLSDNFNPNNIKKWVKNDWLFAYRTSHHIVKSYDVMEFIQDPTLYCYKCTTRNLFTIEDTEDCSEYNEDCPFFQRDADHVTEHILPPKRQKLSLEINEQS